MPSWVTHMMIADGVLTALPELDKRGFCAGSVAPDCNRSVPGGFEPPREVTHFMLDARKRLDDCERFAAAHPIARAAGAEEAAFLAGYYAHLLADARFQAFTRDPARVKAMRQRIRAAGIQIPEDTPDGWADAKALLGKPRLLSEIAAIERAYLAARPDSVWFTVLPEAGRVPDLLPELPKGAIAEKLPLMLVMPKSDADPKENLFLSEAEYAAYVNGIVREAARRLTYCVFPSQLIQ